MIKLYNVVLAKSNIIVKEEDLDEYLYHAGFAVVDCYFVGYLYEPKESDNTSYDEYNKHWEMGVCLGRD